MFQLISKRCSRGAAFAGPAMVLCLLALLGLPQSGHAAVSLAGVHDFSGDTGLVDPAAPSGEKGWAVELVPAVANCRGTLGGERTGGVAAKNAGMQVIYRVDYKQANGRQVAVPVNSGEYDQWVSDFNQCITKLSDLSSLFIVGNEPNLDYELDPLLGYLSTRVLEWDADPANIATLRGQVADRPAFGLNSFFVGGWWTNSSPDGTPSMLFDDAPIPGLIARTAGSLARASEQIVFASSTLRPPGTHKSVQGDEETSGSPYVDAPLLPTGQAWAPALGDPSSVVVTGGAHSTPFARYNRTVATCTGDGGTSGISLRDVSDMRRWTNPATGPEWNYGN